MAVDHNSVNDGESVVHCRETVEREAHTHTHSLFKHPLGWVPQPVKPQTLLGWDLLLPIDCVNMR